MIGAPPRRESPRIADSRTGRNLGYLFLRALRGRRHACGRSVSGADTSACSPWLKEHGRSLIIKLHPFESRSQREKLVREVLGSSHQEFVEVIEGPLTPDLMSRAWFGITVESTTVIDCLQNGVPLLSVRLALSFAL